jgi:hypothetical protein
LTQDRRQDERRSSPFSEGLEMQKKHADFAPSSAARWLKCPASAILGADLPERRSDAADEGTRVHALIEHALVTGVLDHVPEDDLWVVELVRDYVAKLGAGHLAAERRVFVNEHVRGTTDILHLVVDHRVATIGDYKNGAYDVEAIGNAQLLTYGVGVLREFPQIEYFRMVIIQPNSRTDGEVEPVKQWVVPAETVSRHALEIEQALHRAFRGEKPVPGRHCRWCSKFGVCPETSEILGFITTAVQFAPSEISDDLLVRVGRVLRGLGDYKKLVDEEMMQRISAGRAVKDAELGRSRAFRRWRDERMAKQAMFEKFGLDGLSPPSPSEAEKLGAKEIVELMAYKPPGSPKVDY